MACHGSQLMRCPGCSQVWCVPGVVGDATVYHRECSAALQLKLSAEGVDSCTRGYVGYDRDNSRLEVRTGERC